MRIHQAAALPYAKDASGRARVMLITSRQTGRWVLPKGNIDAGFKPHEAAAREAWEEAGLTGITCPTPIGAFRYLKRRKASERELTVAVYPLQVLGQSADWPEREERETRWFDPAAAGDAVQEPELGSLLRAFDGGTASPGCNMVVETPARAMGRFSMPAWFQALMPKQGRFFEQFEAHAVVLVEGANALARLLAGEGDAATQVAAIHDREHEADRITCEVLQDVRRVFVTPFDRSAITSLIGVMDDAIDEMNGFAKAIDLFEVDRFEPGMRDIGGIVVEAARVTAEAMPLLRQVNANAARLHVFTARLIELEGHADEIHDAGLKALYRDHRAADPATADPMTFVIGREMYGRLEKIVDRFEDVANEIQGLVIDHA